MHIRIHTRVRREVQAIAFIRLRIPRLGLGEAVRRFGDWPVETQRHQQGMDRASSLGSERPSTTAGQNLYFP